MINFTLNLIYKYLIQVDGTIRNRLQDSVDVFRRVQVISGYLFLILAVFEPKLWSSKSSYLVILLWTRFLRISNLSDFSSDEQHQLYRLPQQVRRVPEQNQNLQHWQLLRELQRYIGGIWMNCYLNWIIFKAFKHHQIVYVFWW